MGVRETEKSLCRFFVLLWSVIGALTSPETQHPPEAEDTSILTTTGNQKGITEALYEIAQIMRNNQQHSNLYERMAFLEASVKLSLEENKLLERRIKKLEEAIPVMKDKIEVSSNFLTKMESLERSTNSLMEGFEEKLSTLAGEMVRLKSVHAAMQEGKNGDTRSTLPGRTPEGDDAEDTREVDKGKAGLDVREFELNDEEVTSQSAANHLSMKAPVGELREMCPTAPGYSHNSSGCLFSADGKLVSWAIANSFCRSYGASLASLSDIQVVNTGSRIKDKKIIFWISEITTKELLQEKEKFLEENYKYFSDGSNEHVPVSNVKFIDIDEGKDNDSKHINILTIDDTIPQSPLDNTSGLVDIRNLPHSEEADILSERNVYMVNTEPDNRDHFNRLTSMVDESEGEGDSHHVVKRSSVEVEHSLVIPQDAVHFKEFLLLQPTDKDTRQNEFKSDDSEFDNPSSDSGSVDLFSLLTGESESVFPNKLRGKEMGNGVKRCPILSCTKGSLKCVVSLRICSELHSFWCKRDG